MVSESIKQIQRLVWPLTIGLFASLMLRAQSAIRPVDLDQENRFIIVDRRPGRCLGHPTTVLLRDSPTQGDWLAWIGTYDDILNGRPGWCRFRIKDNLHGWDATYPGVGRLPDGTLVSVTSGHRSKDEERCILCFRLPADGSRARFAHRTGGD